MATYYLRSGASGAANGSSWADAYTTLDALLTRTGPTLATGDTIYVSEDHVDTVAYGVAKILGMPASGNVPCQFLCVDHTGSVPPVAADLRTTAQFNYNPSGAFNLTLSGNWGYVYGCNWIVGAGAAQNFSIIVASNANSGIVYDNCLFYMASTRTGNNGIITSAQVFKNCTFKFNGNQQVMTISPGRNIFQNCVVDYQGFTTSSWLNPTSGSQIFADDCDFTATGTGYMYSSGVAGTTAVFKRCKFNSGMALSPFGGGSPLVTVTDLIQCDSGASYLRNERFLSNGMVRTSTAIARVGGMSDNGTPVSHRVHTGATSRWGVLPVDGFPIAVWNNTVGSAITITMEFIALETTGHFGTIPKNDEAWIEVEYLGTSGSTRGTTAKATKDTVLSTGTANTASTADWTAGTVAARANSTAYAVGAYLKVSSNPGKVFMCTTGGNSAASEPGSYATCPEGDFLTDGTSTWRACWRFKVALPITPQVAGLIYVTPRIARASMLYGVYYDPLVTVT